MSEDDLLVVYWLGGVDIKLIYYMLICITIHNIMRHPLADQDNLSKRTKDLILIIQGFGGGSAKINEN